MAKKATQDISGWQHCWAEFYLPGYGWAPVDPADVRKMMLVQNLALTDPKTKESRQYFWDGIDPYRIKLGEGRDLVLNPAQHGEPVNYLMYPFAQIGATTLDWLDPANFKYTITYHPLAAEGFGLIDTDTPKNKKLTIRLLNAIVNNSSFFAWMQPFFMKIPACQTLNSRGGNHGNRKRV
jgi:hypothetical protein